MKLLITALLCATSLSAFGQQQLSSLIGKWEYHDVYQKENIDSTGLKMLEMFFSNMTMQFSKDGLFKGAMMGKEEQGKWRAENDQAITITSDKGSVRTLEIIELDQAKFIFRMQEAALIMTKMPASEVDEIREKEITFTTVKATVEEISKKWYLKRKETSREVSEKIQKAANELLQGSYVEISANGNFEIQIIGMEESGKWEFGEGNESIIFKSEGDKKIWNIISISGTQLVLVPGVTNEKWFFETKKTDKKVR